MVLSLDSLSTELLLKIFKSLDIYDLCRLKQTCRRFNEVIEQWGSLLNKNVVPLITNQVHPAIINRSGRILSSFERLRVSRNWKLGLYKERMLLYSKIKYIPWLQLEKNLLWISRGRCIQAYKRSSKGINTRNVVYTIKGSKNADVCRFVKKSNYILSGQMDGSLWLWSTDDHNFVFDLKSYHDADINSVDICDNIIVSGSRDNYVKIRHKPDDNEAFFHQIDLQGRVWSVALSEENKSLLAIGTDGIDHMSTVHIFDMNKQSFFAHYYPDIFGDILGAGVLDLKWESASVLWSCGYDSYLRRWDLRTGKCEQALGDPNFATVYCFQYDHVNSIISGTNSHGRVVLWDTRQDNYVQMYFMESCRRPGKSSPIYSLSYDADFLFTVTDQHVNVLDFSVFNGTPKDYSNLFGKLIKV
ncbi:F-box/WD repeat-containing protein 4 [Zophobas morio]|uniref:F-box/WD repeat-containing protein 4 n=1 Tax=Zophobas morio TaxID=2755281 RepID=UPI003082FD4D